MTTAHDHDAQMEALDEIAKEARRLRVPMTHVPRDEEYPEVLAYRSAQEIHAIEHRLADLRSLLRRVEAFVDDVVDPPEVALCGYLDSALASRKAPPAIEDLDVDPGTHE